MEKGKVPARILILKIVSCFNIFLLLLFFIVENAFAQSVEEYAVKAAFVLNFARYTQWPDECFTGTTQSLKLGVLGNKTIESAFKTINGKKIGSKTLQVQSILKAEDAGKCHMIFISKDIDHTILLNMVENTRGKAILTIGEITNFIQFGGIINFFSRKGRLHFEINNSLARKQQLKLSSRLLKLAIIVDDKGKNNK